MKLMSFALTTAAFRARTKRVTRRNGWLTAALGQRVMAVEKARGVPVAERVELGPIVFAKVRREPLRRMLDKPAYGRREVVLEGFPDLTPAEFVQMYCKANACT